MEAITNFYKKNKALAYGLTAVVVLGLAAWGVSYAGYNTKSYFNEEPQDLEAWTKSETERLQTAAAAEVKPVTLESIKTRIATDKAQVVKDNKAIDVENKKALDEYNNQSNFWPGNWKLFGNSAPTDKPHKQFALGADLTAHQLTEDKINADDFKLSEEIVTALTTKEREDAKSGAELTEVTPANHVKYTDQVAIDNAASWKRAAGVQAIAPVALAAGASLYGKSLDAAEAQKIADAEAKKIEADKKAKAALAAKKAKEGETPAAEQKDPVTGEPIKVDGAKDPETPEDAEKANNDGLGAWWILIVLAILALVGGAVYFFVFMPKEEDEEFDAEAQVEEEL